MPPTNKSAASFKSLVCIKRPYSFERRCTMPTGPDPWCSLPRAQGKVFTHQFIVCLNVPMFCLGIRLPRVLLEASERDQSRFVARRRHTPIACGPKADP